MKTKGQDDRLARVRAYSISPDDVCLIGRAAKTSDGKMRDNVGKRDTAHREGDHPQWEDRALEPYDEAAVINYLRLGVIEPITVIKEVVHDDGLQDFVVVAGRRRTINSREALRRIREDPKWQHLPELRLRLIQRSGEAIDAMMVAASSNEFRKIPTVLSRARKAALMLKFGASEQDVCDTFGITQQQLTKWLDGLKAAPELLGAVERGEESFSHAADQVRRKKQRDQKPRPKSSAPKRAQLRRITGAPKAMELLERSLAKEEVQEGDVPELLVEMLKWVSGEGTLETFPHLRETFTLLAAPAKKHLPAEDSGEAEVDETDDSSSAED